MSVLVSILISAYYASFRVKQTLLYSTNGISRYVLFGRYVLVGSPGCNQVAAHDTDGWTAFPHGLAAIDSASLSRVALQLHTIVQSGNSMLDDQREIFLN